MHDIQPEDLMEMRRKWSAIKAEAARRTPEVIAAEMIERQEPTSAEAVQCGDIQAAIRRIKIKGESPRHVWIDGEIFDIDFQAYQDALPEMQAFDLAEKPSQATMFLARAMLREAMGIMYPTGEAEDYYREIEARMSRAQEPRLKPAYQD